MIRPCPSCQSDVDAAVPTCPRCAWSFALAGGPAVAVKPAPRPKVLPKVQLAIAIDRTGSTLAFEQGITGNLGHIVRTIAAKAKDLKVWLQSHGDRECGEMEVLHVDGGSGDDAIREAGMVHFEGGGDPPESHMDGIEKLLLTVPWILNPKEARGALVAFVNADSKPAQSGKTPRELGEAIASRGILFYLVCEPTPSLVELADAAQGMVIPITNTPSESEMRMIAAQIAASIVLTVRTGGTVPLAAAS